MNGARCPAKAARQNRGRKTAPLKRTLMPRSKWGLASQAPVHAVFSMLAPTFSAQRPRLAPPYRPPASSPTSIAAPNSP